MVPFKLAFDHPNNTNVCILIHDVLSIVFWGASLFTICITSHLMKFVLCVFVDGSELSHDSAGDAD